MNKKWWKAAGIRAIKTVAQTAAATIGTSAAMGQVNWLMVGSASLLAGVLFGGVTMAIGMLVHEASVLFVIINAMRLLRPEKIRATTTAPQQASARSAGRELVESAH